MRNVWIGLVMLLAGLLLGGLGPRSDLRTAQARIEALEKDLKTSGRKRDRSTGITEMLKIPVREPSADAAPAEPASERRDRELRNETRSAGPPWSRRHTSEEQRQRFREELKTASDAWRVRSDLARNSFVANVTDDPAQAASFDVLMAAMNMRLSNSVSRWAETVSTNRDMDPETGIRMMNELSGVVVLTYDELDRTLPEGWRERAGEDFQLFNFIDPSVVLPLAEREDLSDDAPSPEATEPPNGTSFSFSIGKPDGASDSKAPAQ